MYPLPPHPLHSSPPFQPNPITHSSPSSPNFKFLYPPAHFLIKRQNNQSSTHQLQSNNISNDDNYNSAIAQWRKKVIGPIVKLIQHSQTIYTSSGSLQTYKTFQPQPTKSILTSPIKLQFTTLLQILKSMLTGHQLLYTKLKATSVSIQKTYLTHTNDIKVWINTHLQRNQISGQVLTKQQDIVKKILSILILLVQNSHQPQQEFYQFVRYVTYSMNNKNLWKFSYLRALIRSCSDWRKIKLSHYQQKYQIHQPQNTIINNIKTQHNNNHLIPQQPKFPNIKSKKSQIPKSKISSSLIFSLHINKKHQSSLPSHNSRTSSLNSKKLSKIVINNQKQKMSSLQHIFKHDINNKSVSKSSKNNSNIQRQRVTSTSSPNLLRGLLLSKPNTLNPPPSSRLRQTSPSQIQHLLQIPKPNKLCITQQLNIKINKSVPKTLTKSSKDSSISTNQTSISCQPFYMTNKLKDTNSSLNQPKQTQTLNIKKTPPTQKTNQKLLSSLSPPDPHKLSPPSTNPPLSSKSPPTHIKTSQQSSHLSSPQKQQYPQIISQQKQFLITPIKNNHQPNLLLQFFNQHKFDEEIISIYQNSNQSIINDQMPINIKQVSTKMLQLLNPQQKLAFSTYMRTQSNKKLILSPTPSPSVHKSKKLKIFEQTIQSLINPKTKSQQIFQKNNWNKTLQTLLTLDQQQLNQSISCGNDDQYCTMKQFKLMYLDQCGRFIGKSGIPQ